MEEICYTIKPSELIEEQFIDYLLSNLSYQKIMNILEELEKQMRNNKVKIIERESDK